MIDHFSTQDDAKTVNAWFEEHHDQTVDAVAFSGSPVKSLVALLAKQPEFSDWDRERIEDAIIHDEEKEMTETIGQNMKIRRSDDEGLISFIEKQDSNSHDKMATAFNQGGIKALAKYLTSGFFSKYLRDWNVQDVAHSLERIGTKDISFLLGNLTSNKEGSLNEMNAADIVGWVGEGYAFCTDHMTPEQAEGEGLQPIFASSEGWEDITCDNHSDGIHTLGDTAGIGQDSRMDETGYGLALENLIAKAVKRGIRVALEEGKGKPTDKSEKHDRVGKKYQKGSEKKKEDKKEIQAAKKITRSQLAEGVRKALRMALKEAGMPGGAMPSSGGGAGSTMPPTQESVSDGEGMKKGSMTGGHIPSPEELQNAIDEQGGWNMDLRGADYFAFEYAMLTAGIGNPDMNSGAGMHAVLTALTNAPAPDDLPDSIDDEEIDNPHSNLNKLLTSWEVRYGRHGELIEDHAQSVASSILDVLGWEWV